MTSSSYYPLFALAQPESLWPAPATVESGTRQAVRTRSHLCFQKCKQTCQVGKAAPLTRVRVLNGRAPVGRAMVIPLPQAYQKGHVPSLPGPLFQLENLGCKTDSSLPVERKENASTRWHKRRLILQMSFTLIRGFDYEPSRANSGPVKKHNV